MTPKPKDKPAGKVKHRMVEDDASSHIPLRHVENTGERYKGPHGRPTQMKKPARVRRKAKFEQFQVACIVGMEPPMGLVVIERDNADETWGVDVEVDGKLENRTMTSGELRPLTAKEIGPRRERGQ